MSMNVIVKRRKLLSAFLMLVLALSFSVNAQAATKTYGVKLERGIKHLCYTKDVVNWKANTSTKKISKYTATQSANGLFAVPKGVKKNATLSTSKKYALLCKHRFLAGAVIKGVTLGYRSDINDMLYIHGTGKYSVTWDY